MRAIVTYHSIDTSGSPISVTPQALGRQLAWFVSAGVRVVSVDELLAAGDRDRHAVALTFDDAYASVMNEAVPLLDAHGLVATLFVVTRSVGSINTWNVPARDRIPELPLLGWDDLGRLAERGFVIASHGRTHRRLSRLSVGEMEDEVGGAADDLRRWLGQPPVGLAYPYGDVSSEVQAVASRHCQWACTTELRELDDECALRLPRIDMWYFSRRGLLESWGTPRFRRWVRRRHRLRRIRAAIGGFVGSR
jgi:peptidoglycan/xylan/chitin deacetylase (PgdA/CDA1 family)